MAGCQRVPEEAAPATTPAARPAAQPATEDIEAQIQGALGGALGLGPTLPELPSGLVVEGNCQAVDAAAASDHIAAGAAARIPLREGLTLSILWRTESVANDIECLQQIRRIDAPAIELTASCNRPDGTDQGQRRTCRSDLREAQVYYTEFGGESPVTTLVGATSISLSEKAFADLVQRGATPHRYVMVAGGRARMNLEGTLRREGRGSARVIVNDRLVELPVIRATAAMRGTCEGQPCEKQFHAEILDDARFPLVLDYGTDTNFRIRYSKMSFPTDGALERELQTSRRVDVYGIYFDFASDRIRAESAPVLQEIADVLAVNPDWTLVIEGHTDAVGSADSNLRLSQRRSEAVGSALVERGVAAARLTTAGYGASRPKDTNSTPEGRARNRRVELVRP
jgi:outer membrane protein OmpA-like peptidoglycan-associated protein